MTEAADPARRDGAFNRAQLLMLGGITLLAAGLRLYRLGEWSLWVDEAHTFREIVAGDERFWASDFRYFPLSYLLLRTLCLDFGMPTSEGWLRLPFAFFGILSVPALGLLGRGLVGARAALTAALLLAVSPWHVFWSQNARSYSMVLFFALLAAGSFYQGMVRRSPLGLAAAFGLTLVAGLCHPSAYILLGGLLVYGFFATRDRQNQSSELKKWLPAVILVLIAAVIVVLLPLLQQVRRSKPDFSLFHLVQTLVFFVRTPLIVAAVGGLLLLFDRGDRAAPFLLCWVLIPVLALAVLASGITKVTAQYAFYTLPALCLLAGAIVVALAGRVKAAGFRGHLLRIVPLGMLLLDMYGQTYLYFEKSHGERPRWQEAREFIVAQRGQRMRVLTTNGPSMQYYLDPGAFAGKPGPTFEVRPLARYVIEAAGGGRSFMQQEVLSARADGVELVAVVTEPELSEMDPGGLMDAFLRRNFHQRRRLPNWTGPKDMTVLVYWLP